jgi:hypothetical protein
MSENSNFQEFSLYSSLFKGRTDLFYCYLKAEKIVHVLILLAQRVPENGLQELAHQAEHVPSAVADIAAGELPAHVVLAQIFTVLTSIRLLATRNVLAKDTAAILLSEYEMLAQRLEKSVHPSPFVAPEDFLLPPMPGDGEPVPLSIVEAPRLKDMYKGQATQTSKRHDQSDRTQVILDFIRARQSVSIKDICQLPDPSIRSCSEKTIQRELGDLIRRGLVQKVGERRWSQYKPL